MPVDAKNISCEALAKTQSSIHEYKRKQTGGQRWRLARLTEVKLTTWRVISCGDEASSGKFFNHHFDISSLFRKIIGFFLLVFFFFFFSFFIFFLLYVTTSIFCLNPALRAITIDNKQHATEDVPFIQPET